MLRKSIILQILVFTVIFCGWEQIKGQESHNQSQSNDEKIYRPSEVDVKAEFTTKPLIKDISNCKGSGNVTLRLVLHKSGEISSVEVVKPSPCKSFDKKAIKAAQQINFVPAIKDGEKVSQRVSIQYSYEVK